MHITKTKKCYFKRVWPHYESAAAWYKSPHTFAAVDTGQLFNGKKNCPVTKRDRRNKKVADVESYNASQET